MSAIQNDRDVLLAAATTRLGVVIGGMNALITNEAHAVAADSAGNVTSYSGATGEFKVFAGSVDISTNFTLSTLVNLQALTIGYVGRTYTVTGGFDSTEQIASVTIRATGNAGTVYAGLVFDKVFSLIKTQPGAGAFTIVTRGFTKMLTANSIVKEGGITGWGDADAYSVEGFTGGAYVSWQMGQANKFCMVALNSDPLTNQSWETLDYAIEPLNNGNFDIYESGTPRGVFGTYDANTVFTIAYDGSDIKYYKDGVVIRTVVGVGSNLKFHMDSALYDQGVIIKNLAFGPVGLRGATGAAGTNGTNGTRGSIEVIGSGTSWSDATADAAILAATGSSLRVFGDSATIAGTGFAETRRWNGSAWINPGQVFSGNMFVTGTITTQALVANAATAASNSVFSHTGVDPGAANTSYSVDEPAAGLSLTTTGAPVKLFFTLYFEYTRQAAGVPQVGVVTTQLVVDGSPVGNTYKHNIPPAVGAAAAFTKYSAQLSLAARLTGLTAAAHSFKVRITFLLRDSAGNLVTFGAAAFVDVNAEIVAEENKV